MCFNTRKIISVFLTVAMLISALAVPAFAEETETVTDVIEESTKAETEEIDDITETEEITIDYVDAVEENADFTTEGIQLMTTSSGTYYSDYGIYFDKSSGTITGADNNFSVYSIPENIDGVTVTKVGSYAFQNCTKMKGIELPDTIVAIYSYAFSGCTGLEEINITASRLESVYSYAFSNCTALMSATFSCNLLNTINDYVFQGCVSLATVDVSANPILTHIGREVFSGCSLLTNVKLPASLTAMGYRAFYNCTALQSIEIPPKADTYGNYYGNYYGQWFYGCTALKSITIADGAIKIPDYAFQDCTSFTAITIPDTVTAVGKSAFSGCTQLTELPTMNGLITIGYGAFAGCKGLSSLSKLPDTVTVIGSYAFENCIDLENITWLPSALETIGSCGFSGCKYLEKVILPVGLLTINNNAFQNCTYLEYIFIPDSVTSIGDSILQSDSDAVIYGMDNSYAKTYAASNNIPFVTLTDIPDEKISVTGVQLNKSVLDMTVGESETLTATVTPENATSKGVTWTSSNTSVATVSNGKVTAKSVGEATITVTTADGGYTAMCTVKVSEKAPTTVPVTGVTLNKSAASLEKGKTETLVATVNPSNATNKNVSWKSSNSSVATVANGVVTAVSAGSAVITATTSDGGFSAECKVTVTEKTVTENAPTIKISDIKTMPGKEVQVTVDLSNNTGFASLGIEVGYNANVMKLTKVTSNSGVGGIFTPAQTYDANPFNMGWNAVSNITYNGNLATLTFTVLEGVPDGVYPITLDYYKGVNGNYVDGSSINYDENFDAVGFVYVSGNAVVASYIPGDVNGDEVVDNKDATFLLRYLAGWNVSGLVEDALDVDGSGTVDNKDGTILLRYLAGWEVTLH